ncbi:hypothetical protein [Serratia marcescens]|uniref:hypothetical protein n=1 Tax=Serratia marcescens TaxID=615 RepID=UPI0037CCE0CE
MDNKLSELSKPVMYSITCNGVVEEIGGDSQGFSREEVQAELDLWDAVVPGAYTVSALYSQEYVSALIQRAERIDSMLTESVQALKAVEQRNAELEAKLATPVRLPNKSDDEFWFDGVFQVAKFDRAVERAISAAGFKFVGDE